GFECRIPSGKLDSSPEFRDGFVVLMLLLQSLTQLIMGDGEMRIHFDGLLTLLHGFVIPVSDAQCIREVGADDEGEGILALRLFQFSDTLVIPSYHDQVPGVPVMSRRIAGIERERAL